MNAITGQCSPTSIDAGRIAQAFANADGQCGYSECNEPHTACVVHREGANSAFINVCERHRGWELAKTEISIWDWD